MGGTMGLSLAGFSGMWTLMMAAMMLPSVAPLAVLYARTFRRRRIVRLSAFTLTYLTAWAVSAASAWAMLRIIELHVVPAAGGTIGTMHLGAMIALTMIVAAEKLLPVGRELALATGAVCLVAAIAVWWAPALAPGLT